jgi:CrcB protein
LLVAIGGAAGAMLRYWVGVVAAERFGPKFPLGTFSINVSACVLIGFTLEYLKHHAGVNPVWRYAFAIGFIGAYSTFSTYEWEIWSDFTSGAFWWGVLYLVASLVAGLVAVAAGAMGAKALS